MPAVRPFGTAVGNWYCSAATVTTHPRHLSKIFPILPAAALALAFAAPAAGAGDMARARLRDVPASTDVPAPVRSTEPITVAPPPPIDVMQQKITDAFVSPIAWFDGFFFSEREEIETNRSYMRFITGTVWANGDGFKYRQSVRVKVRVPGLKERLNLLFSTDDEEETGEAPTAVTRRAALSRTRAESRLGRDVAGDRSRAGLGYRLLRALDTDVDVETALRSKGRGEVTLQLKRRFGQEVTRSKLLLTGFWLQDTGFGSRARFNVERPATERSVFHWDNALTQVHAINGVVYDSRVSLDVLLSERTGLSPAISINAVTRPVYRIETYLASLVFRRQFFRDWLFYELEPGINWSRDEFGAYPPLMTGAIRFEIQFKEGE